MTRRTKRVASMIRGELARALVEGVEDPVLDGMVITEVALTDDLKSAQVYFSAMEEKEDEKEVRQAWKRALPFFRKYLSEHLALRYVPRLRFVADDHTDSVNRVLSLLDEVNPSRSGEWNERGAARY